MIPAFNEDGLLPPGIHPATWDELATRFGANPWRQSRLKGLRAALENLKQAGCRTVYINGSFVTSKERPNDFDACWETKGVNPLLLDPVLLNIEPGRVSQKAKYMGEFFPLPLDITQDRPFILELFQTDRPSRGRKGIVRMDLEGLN